MESQARIEEFRSFLARGDLGFYGYVEGRVVHRAWVRPGPVRVPTWHSFAPLDIGENEAWIHYCETAPEARGKGIYPAVLGEVVARLRKAGTTRCTIGTEASNLASRRGIEKAGFEPWCTLRIVVLFGGLVTRVTKATKGAQE